jgi:hypothetical protein
MPKERVGKSQRLMQESCWFHSTFPPLTKVLKKKGRKHLTNVKNHIRTHKEKNNKLTDKTLMTPLGTNNYMSLPLT